eukprot:COSAG04_NODE_16781_length_489_cov_0.928205_1_plen_66_part_10
MNDDECSGREPDKTEPGKKQSRVDNAAHSGAQPAAGSGAAFARLAASAESWARSGTTFSRSVATPE